MSRLHKTGDGVMSKDDSSNAFIERERERGKKSSAGGVKEL